MTTTKDGNAVLLPEEDYSGIMETLYLVSVPGMREKLRAAKAEPLEDCVDESAVEWFTHMYSSFVELIRKNIQDLPLV